MGAGHRVTAMILEHVILIVRARQDRKALQHQLCLDLHREETSADDKRGATIEVVHR